jgi:DNA-directed RNA polymerase specialized sigma subunit
MPISVENKAGSYRTWYDKAEQREGKTKQLYDYGYIRGTLGTDGDHVDVYVGPNEAAKFVYVIDQMKGPDFTKFDEQKVMLGFDSDTEARTAYLAHFDSSKFFGSLRPMGVADFKRCVLNKENHGAPIDKALRATLQKGQLYIGPRGGRWGNPQHTIPYHEEEGRHFDEKQRQADKLFKKIRRRGQGQGAEVQLTKSELNTILSTGRFALVSAGPNPEIESDRDMTAAQAKRRHRELKGKLVQGGYMHTPVVGHYGGREDSFLVMIHDAKRGDVRALGKMFKQDSVIYAKGGKNELHFTHGPNADKNLCAEGKSWAPQPEAKDFYTRVNHPGGGSSKFSLNLDFDHLKPCSKGFTFTLEKAIRPPKGYTVAPRSKKGAYRKKTADGYDYWYPGEPHPVSASKAPKKKDAPKGGKTKKKAPKHSEGEQLAVFSESKVDPKKNPGIHKMESGQFHWMRSRTYEMSADGKNIRSTTTVPSVDEETKLQLIKEFQPLIKSEARKAMAGFALKQRYEQSDTGTFEEVEQELRRGGVEGLLTAIRNYEGGGPFAHYAKNYVHGYTRLEAGRQQFASFKLPEMHVRNLRRFIAAKVQAGIKHKTTSPTIRQIAKKFDLRLKHVHKRLPEIRRNELVPMEPYKLQLGRPGKQQKVKTRGGRELAMVPMRDVAERRSRIEWVQMYEDFLAGQKGAIQADESEKVFSEIGAGAGMNTEDQIIVRNQIDKALGVLRGLGDAAIVRGTPGSRKKPATYSVADLGDILKHRLGLGYEEHSVRQLAEVIPVYRQNADGDWVEISERSAHPLLQEFVKIGMEKLRETAGDTKAGGVIERAMEVVAPKERIPLGPSYHELMKKMADSYTAGQVKAHRQRQMNKMAVAADKTGDPDRARAFLRTYAHLEKMSASDMALDLARKSDEGQKLSKEMRAAMTRTMDVERTDAHGGVAYMYDPATNTHRSVRVSMNYDKKMDRSLQKAFGTLSATVLREIQHWPLTMELLSDQGPHTPERHQFEQLVGVR